MKNNHIIIEFIRVTLPKDVCEEPKITGKQLIEQCERTGDWKPFWEEFQEQQKKYHPDFQEER